MNKFYYDENSLLTLENEYGTVKISPDDFWLTDKYGNTITLKGMGVAFKRNSPTYDELYEYWLKTKYDNEQPDFIPCHKCARNQWDLPECKECNSENNYKHFKRW